MAARVNTHSNRGSVLGGVFYVAHGEAIEGGQLDKRGSFQSVLASDSGWQPVVARHGKEAVSDQELWP